MINRAFAKTYASTIAPDPSMNCLWMDLSSNHYGKVIKYWDGAKYDDIFQSVDEMTSSLNGTNYLMVYGTGTPTENATELQTVYTETAKMPRYIGEPSENQNIYKGQTLLFDSQYYNVDSDGIFVEVLTGLSTITEVKAKSVRTSVIVAPGVYTFSTPFLLINSGINIISLTGNIDVIVNGGITIQCEYSFIKGIDASSTNDSFKIDIADSNGLEFEKCIGKDRAFSTPVGKNLLVKCTSCKGGLFSFNSGNSQSTFGEKISAGSAFIDCEAVDNSFGFLCKEVNATYIRCKAINYSFASIVNQDNYSKCIDCKGSTGCFGFSSINRATALFENCTSGTYSFGGTDGENLSSITGTVFKNCVVNGDSGFGGGATTNTGHFISCTSHYSDVSSGMINGTSVMNCLERYGDGPYTALTV